MKYILVIILFFGAPDVSFSQSRVDGLIINSETKKIIPYVNIGIIKLRKGTVSNSEGMFSLAYSSLSDSITFSVIGYQLKRISVSDMLEMKRVQLEPKIYDMQEIVVKSNTYNNAKVFGNKQSKKGQSFGFGSGELGSEIGARIKVRKEILIESAHFTVNFTGSDSMKYRINLYEMDGNSIGDNLIKENLIISGKQERGTISIDLSELNITTKTDVLLSLEWIEHGKTDTNNGMMFRAKKVRKKNANSYLKYTSFSEYRKVEEVSNELGFYLMGREIKE